MSCLVNPRFDLVHSRARAGGIRHDAQDAARTQAPGGSHRVGGGAARDERRLTSARKPDVWTSRTPNRNSKSMAGNGGGPGRGIVHGVRRNRMVPATGRRHDPTTMIGTYSSINSCRRMTWPSATTSALTRPRRSRSRRPAICTSRQSGIVRTIFKAREWIMRSHAVREPEARGFLEPDAGDWLGRPGGGPRP